jgi:hypothetical protein
MRIPHDTLNVYVVLMHCIVINTAKKSYKNLQKYKTNKVGKRFLHNRHTSPLHELMNSRWSSSARVNYLFAAITQLLLESIEKIGKHQVKFHKKPREGWSKTKKYLF